MNADFLMNADLVCKLYSDKYFFIHFIPESTLLEISKNYGKTFFD